MFLCYRALQYIIQQLSLFKMSVPSVYRVIHACIYHEVIISLRVLKLQIIKDVQKF